MRRPACARKPSRAHAAAHNQNAEIEYGREHRISHVYMVMDCNLDGLLAAVDTREIEATLCAPEEMRRLRFSRLQRADL